MRGLFAIAILALSAACSGHHAPLVATDVDIHRPMAGLQVSAGYLALTNNTSESIVITDVSSPQFGSVEMHESKIEDGISRMRPLAELAVLPGETVRFQPGGKHLMLMRPKEDLNQVTLEFHAGQSIVLRVDTALTDEAQ